MASTERENGNLRQLIEEMSTKVPDEKTEMPWCPSFDFRAYITSRGKSMWKSLDVQNRFDSQSKFPRLSCFHHAMCPAWFNVSQCSSGDATLCVMTIELWTIRFTTPSWPWISVSQGSMPVMRYLARSGDSTYSTSHRTIAHGTIANVTK